MDIIRTKVHIVYFGVIYMVVHIVMIKFKENTQRETIESIASAIEALKESVPSLLKMEVGLNFAQEDRAMDLVLTAHFRDREGLSAYAVDPEHLKVIEAIKRVADYSRVVDYETL